MFPLILRNGWTYLQALTQELAERRRIAIALSSTLAISASLGSGSALAQSANGLEACAPPLAGEYLLLVVVQAADAEDKLRQTLPPSVKAPTCNYLGTRVARMGGFRKPEDADAWASYLREVAALPAFIAQPSQSSSSSAPATAPAAPPVAASPTPNPANAQPSVTVPPLTTPSNPASPQLSAADIPQPNLNSQPMATANPSSVSVPPLNSAPLSSPSFTPQSLAPGYVVLVDYGNQPAIADRVEIALQRTIGLASYGQRPYLLAHYSADSAIAIATLRNLTQRGFNAILVDSQGVVVLADRVR